MKAWLVLVAILILLIACGGKRFDRVPASRLTLGVTTSADIRDWLGKPYQTGTLVKNGKEIPWFSYAYARSGGDGDGEGVLPSRSQGFYFFRDQLVGYEFTSSWKDDSTSFDDDRAARIREGATTRAQAVRDLGPPGGKYIYPLISDQSAQADVWLHVRSVWSGFVTKLHQRTLVVTWGDDGVATDIEYISSTPAD